MKYKKIGFHFMNTFAILVIYVLLNIGILEYRKEG